MSYTPSPSGYVLYAIRRARFTPSSVIPVGHSSEATSLNSAKLWRAPTPHRSDPGPATYMVALSALRRVRPYRWRPLSPNIASCSLATVSAAAATWRQALALMTVTQHGGTSSPAPMAANGMPFATGIESATVVHVGTILVAVKPTWVGYSDGERPRDLMSCSSASGVKCECRVDL